MKYELTDEILEWDGHTLHKIRRLKDGKLGGWIESEDNLSQKGKCWVSGNAKVYEDAKVYGNALITDGAWVSGNAKISGNARVSDVAWVKDKAKVKDNAIVSDFAIVYGKAKILDDASVTDCAHIYDSTIISDNAAIYGHANIYGNAKIYEHAKVFDYAQVYDNAQVFGKASVFDNAQVFGKATISGNISINKEVKLSKGNRNVPLEELDKPDENIVKAIKEFLNNADHAGKLKLRMYYNSIDEFFETPPSDSSKMDIVEIVGIDVSSEGTSLIPLIKIIKDYSETTIQYVYYVNVHDKYGDEYHMRNEITSRAQLKDFITRTGDWFDSIKSYTKYYDYVNDLDHCL